MFTMMIVLVALSQPPPKHVAYQPYAHNTGNPILGGRVDITGKRSQAYYPTVPMGSTSTALVDWCDKWTWQSSIDSDKLAAITQLEEALPVDNVVMIDNGTPLQALGLTLITKKIGMGKVRVLEGKYKGKEGWILAGWLSGNLDLAKKEDDEMKKIDKMTVTQRKAHDEARREKATDRLLETMDEESKRFFRKMELERVKAQQAFDKLTPDQKKALRAAERARQANMTPEQRLP
jgi:hypothetical protein